MSGDTSGRAPRNNYFCSDLTAKHERFHVAHHFFYFLEQFHKGVAWLNQHTARTSQQALKLVERMRQRVESYALARLGMNVDTGRWPEEDAAYAAGSEAYQQRSDGIRTKGKAGGYP